MMEDSLGASPEEIAEAAERVKVRVASHFQLLHATKKAYEAINEFLDGDRVDFVKVRYELYYALALADPQYLLERAKDD